MLTKECTFIIDSFYNLTGLPVRYYNGAEFVRMLPPIPGYLDPLGHTLQFLFDDERTVSYRVTDEILYYGKVNSLTNDGVFIVGPGYFIPPSSDRLTDIMIGAALSHSNRVEFTDFLTRIPTTSFENFLNGLCFLNFALNRRMLTVEALLLQGNSLPGVGSGIRSDLEDALFNSEESNDFHDTHQLEQRILAGVREGNIEELADLFENSVRGKAGPLAKDALRQEKNIMIISTTLVTRAAIEGGMDIETAYHLSDLYIQQAEPLSRLDSVSLLRQRMVMDFAERVSLQKYPPGISPATAKCIRYIRKRINSPILVRELANDIGINPSYLSRKFYSDMGNHLNDYINRQKINEAKKLLVLTDKTLGEISSYLSFSSQSYFQNLFRKFEDTTPIKYRNSFRVPS
ncbi:helix-turn-helix domain-containing protein [Cohnella fermenti]|nr:helix-turn-helix domain-containing protein [Cohnella fermenti]